MKRNTIQFDVFLLQILVLASFIGMNIYVVCASYSKYSVSQNIVTSIFMLIIFYL
jgi:hypothetical protein